MPLLSTYYNFLVRGIDKTNKGNQMRRQSCTHQTIFSFFSGKADSIYRVIVKPNEPSFLFFCFFFSATHTQHQHLMWRCVYRTESKWDKRFKVLRSWSSACQVRHIVFRRTREMRNTAIHSDMMILDSRWICNRRPNKNLSTLRLVGKLNKVEKKEQGEKTSYRERLECLEWMKMRVEIDRHQSSQMTNGFLSAVCWAQHNLFVRQESNDSHPFHIARNYSTYKRGERKERW